MSQQEPVFPELDERTRGTADRGVEADRKAWLTDCTATYETLDAAGIDIPHRNYADSEDIREFPTTLTCPDGTRVHLHQDVREVTDDEFGAFGPNVEDLDDVIWTVVDLSDEAVTLTVVGDWGKRRTVEAKAFSDEYEPITVDVSGVDHPVPRWGY